MTITIIIIIGCFITTLLTATMNTNKGDQSLSNHSSLRKHPQKWPTKRTAATRFTKNLPPSPPPKRPKKQWLQSRCPLPLPPGAVWSPSRAPPEVRPRPWLALPGRVSGGGGGQGGGLAVVHLHPGAAAEPSLHPAVVGGGGGGQGFRVLGFGGFRVLGF